MGVSSLSALFSEFEEVTEKGSLSLGDFAQMVMSLSMGLTTLYSGIKAIGSITVVAANAETKEEAITLAQAAAKKVFAKATLSAEASMALFVAAVAAAIVVVAGIIAIYNKFFNTQKQFDKSNEKLQESIETWKDYQSQVESIESEIESLQE
jgi:cell division protein FtsL